MSEYIVYDAQAGLRLDQYLAEVEPTHSRNFFQKNIKEGHVLVNQAPAKANYRVNIDDRIEVEEMMPEEISIAPQKIALDILYEDNDILVVNKPKGMVVHPAPGHPDGTLVNAILYHCKDSLSGINGEIRPGIVHRIDRDTTGSLIVCKNDFSHTAIAAQIKEHSCNRIYRGIVIGHMSDDEGVIDAPISRHPKDRKRMAVVKAGGREAITHYHVLERFRDYTYMEFRLETGRTHQIRVHMAHIGHPLLGDEVYGAKKCPYRLEGQTLHAATIGFVHPRSGAYIEVEAPLPDYMTHLLEILPK